MRMFAPFCCLMLASPCWSQIAYVRKNHLYVLRCSASGLPSKGAQPVLICSVNAKSAGELTLAWNAFGEIELFSSSKLFGVVKAVRGAKLRRSSEALSDFPPVHSPDGSVAVVFTSYPEKKGEPTSPWYQDAYLVSKRDHSRVLLQRKSEGSAIWSPNGKLLVLPFTGERGTFSKVVDYPSLKTRFEVIGFPGGESTFSPDGRVLAILDSAPLETRATEFYDAETGTSVGSGRPPGRWQTSFVTSWSPDCHHYLAEYRAQDGEDRWTKHCVAMGDLITGKTRVIPGTVDAKDPAYAQDGSHFFWIFGKSRRLEWVDAMDQSRRKVIARDVAGFAVRR